MSISLTQHANRRAQQRAIRPQQIEQLFLLSDLVIPVDRHLSALRISREALRDAVANGMAPADADRLVGRTMVLADDGSIVSLAHLHGRKARAYRQRDRRPYWKGGK